MSRRVMQLMVAVWNLVANIVDAACHARPEDPPFAGNLPLKVPFGTKAPTVPKEFSERANVFEARCAMCHRSNGATVPVARQTTIQASVPDSVVQAIRHGIRPPIGALGRSTAALGNQLSATETTNLLKFLRARFSNRAPWRMEGPGRPTPRSHAAPIARPGGLAH